VQRSDEKLDNKHCWSPILFNLYGCLTKEAPGGCGFFQIGQVIWTVKYADNLVLLAEEETILQGTTDRVTEYGRCY